MKKILLVNDIIAGGGVEKLMQDFTLRWHDRYDVTVMTTEKQHEVYQVLPENVKYWFKTTNKCYDTVFSFKYIKFLVKKFIFAIKYRYIKYFNDYDVVIAMKDGEVTKLIADFKAPKKFAWNHTDYSAYYYTKDIYGSAENELECFKKYTNVVCVAQDIKNSLIKIIGDAGNYVVKYNPLDVEKILYEGNEPVIDIEKKEGRPLFVVVGRINYQKGYDLLLEAAHMLENDRLDFDVVVVGGREEWGDEYERLIRTRERLGIKNVNFIGPRANPHKYMKVADWLLSTSIFEGFSFVSQEAALLDTPLILTECSGVRELLGNNEYGIVIEPSVLGIYEGMKRVIENPDLQKHYKEKIMERKKIIDEEQRYREIEKLVFGD